MLICSPPDEHYGQTIFVFSTQESLTLLFTSQHPFTLDSLFQRPAVESCQESLSSAVGLMKRKTNSRFPRLGVVCFGVWAAVYRLLRSGFLLLTLLSRLLTFHSPHVTRGESVVL